MLLTLVLMATTARALPSTGQAQAHVSVRIIQAGRVVGGRSDVPAARGTTFVQSEDGRRLLLRLVEFN
jgi:hypothetical protein